MIVKILITLLCGSLYANGTNLDDSIKTLTHLLTNQKNSLTVEAFICWEQEYATHLIKVLNGRNFMVAIHNNRITNFPANQHNNFIVLDLECGNVSQAIERLQPQVFYRQKMIAINSVSEGQVLKIFSNHPILPSSEIFYFQNNSEGIIVKQIYRASIETSLIIELYGKWFAGNDTFHDLRKQKITSRRRRNLNGAKLKASMVVTNNDTFLHLDDYQNKHIDTISKVNYQLTNRLIESLNATVSYSIVDSWGYKNNETNQWSGMIGELTSKRADLGASPLFFTSDRVEAIDYIACTSETRSKFVFRSPKLSYTDNVFLLPFDAKVWASLMSMVFISSLVLYIGSRAEWKSNISREEKDPSTLRPTLYETFFVLLCAFCQQGSFSLPISFGSRLITMISFTALMFMYASYSANIVALLQSPSSKIQTLEDLYNSRLELGVDDTVFNHYYFSHADEPVRHAIYANKIRKKDGHENFFSLSHGVERVQNGLFAFHMELGVGYKILQETFQEDEKCGLQEIQYLQVIDPFYAIQKNSSYTELFKVGLLSLREFGLQDRENSRLYTKKPKCIGHGSKFISVGLFDIQPALMILIYGIGASLVVAFLEIFYEKRLRRIDWMKGLNLFMRQQMETKKLTNGK